MHLVPTPFYMRVENIALKILNVWSHPTPTSANWALTKDVHLYKMQVCNF